VGTLVNYCAGTNIEVLPGKKVDAILVNAAQGGTPGALPLTIDLLKSCGAVYKAVDSGGYQILKAQEEGKNISFDESRPLECSQTSINITPRHVVEVYTAIAREVKLDMGVALDFPILTLSDPTERESEFLSKLGYNVSWAIQTAELRKKLCPEVPLFIPVQCYDLIQFELFWRCIKGIEFDGFSMPVRNLGLREIALFLAKFHQLGIRRVHLLGTTTFPVISLCAYMARHLFNVVSVDSTTWRKSAEYSIFLNPHDLSPESLGGDTQIDERIRNDCPCPFCRGKTFTYLRNLPYTERTHFLRCHNFWVTDNACKELYKNSGNIVELERFLRAKCSKPDFINELIDSIISFHLLAGSDPGLLKAAIS
jgi:queuine/archaeosine tRNA-ribosyltransferase